MRFQAIALSLSVLAGCATTHNLPGQAPPFTSDRRIVWPERALGQLEVHAFARSSTSTSTKPDAPWRLYDAEGRPVTEVLREDGTFPVPPGAYVVVARDTRGALRNAQVVVAAGAVTRVALATQSETMDGPYVPDTTEW